MAGRNGGTSGTLAATTLPLLIGTRLGLASDTVNGSLDDLRIYNRTPFRPSC